MALVASDLQSLIDSKVQSAGFDLSKSSFQIMSKAIAEAVVEHITANAQVVVSSGSSAGTYTVS